jgi:hypothetical protein
MVFQGGTMSDRTPGLFTTEFKEREVLRLEAGEQFSALAAELGVRRKLLYDWRKAYRRLGVTGLNSDSALTPIARSSASCALGLKWQHRGPWRESVVLRPARQRGWYDGDMPQDDSGFIFLPRRTRNLGSSCCRGLPSPLARRDVDRLAAGPATPQGSTRAMELAKYRGEV